MKIAVDAMGGDFGPAVVVEGAAAAAREFGAVVTLVGDKAAIEREVARVGAGTLGLEIRHASQVVSMGESPSQALRRKRDSSLRIAAQLVKDGEAAAFVSAGNTGAAMAIGMFVIGVLPGVDRPAIAAVVPNLKRFTVLLDVGANVDPKPAHLMQFAVMGHVYARDILGFDNPRIDYSETGGAPLLGIDGTAIICHGALPVKAIKNAVRVARDWAKAGVNEHIKAALEAEVARGWKEGDRE